VSRIPLTHRTIWITGASSGIGRTLAERLVDGDNTLIVTARSGEKLERLRQLAPDRIKVVTADIANPECVPALTADLAAAAEAVDTVILNAGTCEYLDVEEFDSALVDRVIQVNLLGLSRSIAAVLPLLRNSQNSPHIVGVSSASAITGLPRAEAYGASKAGIASFLESLGLDLARFGITVSVIYPGFVDTPLTRQNDFPMPFLMTPEDAATRILDGIEKRKLKITFPAPLICGLKLMASLPEGLRFWLGKKMVRDARDKGDQG